MSNAGEDGIRASLNTYYSSKSTAQATYLLTVGLIAVGVISLRIYRLPLTLILSVLVAASVRMAFRVTYWGRLSQRVLSVPPDTQPGRPLIYAFHEGAVENLEKEWFWHPTVLKYWPGRKVHTNLRIWSLFVIAFVIAWIILNYTPFLVSSPVPLTYSF